MAKDKNYDWLNDAFDDEKNKEEIERAKRSRNIGCLVAVLIFFVAALVLSLVSCTFIGDVILGSSMK